MPRKDQLTCRKCKKQYPRERYAIIAPNRRDRFCIECRFKAVQEQRHGKPQPQDLTCNTCHQLLPARAFSRCARNPTGREYICRQCRSAKRRAKYAEAGRLQYAEQKAARKAARLQSVLDA